MAAFTSTVWPTKWRIAVILLHSLVGFGLAAITEPAPLVIDPSQYWEGNDGAWSTFSLSIGPARNVTRVLVSTAIPNAWVVRSDACDSAACATARGDNLFNPNKSTSWQDQGIFNLYYESNLGYVGNGDYGIDTVRLGFSPTNATTVADQLVVAIIQDDFWLGYLGVNPQATNLTQPDRTESSLLQAFKDKQSIPSLSYSYTAGANYRNKGVFGQLILGGYDTSRYQENDLDFNMAEDITRDIVVGVQSLQSTESNGKTTNLLNDGILAYVDSSVPWIVLPDAACDTIESTFGISQDNATGLYLISDSQHNALSSRNPSFTFVLGNNDNGGKTISITIPYDSLDLNIGSPYVNTTSRYMPLKRGNDTTYTLGRAFLQEVYLTANYEHLNFSLSQAVFDEGAKAAIQPIHALGYVSPAGSSGDSSSPGSGSGGLSTGAIVGIVIVVILLLTAIATLLFLRRTRRWPFHRHASSGLTELDSAGNAIGHEKDGIALLGRFRGSPNKRGHPAIVAEADSGDSKSRLHGYYHPELSNHDGMAYKSELPGAVERNSGIRNELQGSHGATEVEGSPGIAMELPGSPVGNEYLRRPSQNDLDSKLSPQSPNSEQRRGSDISPDGGRLSPNLSPSRSRGSKTPVSPQSGTL